MDSEFDDGVIMVVCPDRTLSKCPNIITKYTLEIAVKDQSIT